MEETKNSDRKRDAVSHQYEEEEESFSGNPRPVLKKSKLHTSPSSMGLELSIFLESPHHDNVKRIIKMLADSPLNYEDSVQIRKVLAVLAKRAYGLKKSATLCLPIQSELTEMVEKQLTNSGANFKMMGVLGAVAVVNVLSNQDANGTEPCTENPIAEGGLADSGEEMLQASTTSMKREQLQHALQLIDLVKSCTEKTPGVVSFFIDELATLPLIKKMNLLCHTAASYQHVIGEEMDTLLGRTCCILYERALVLDEFGSSSQPEKDIICRSLLVTFNWLVEVLNSLMVRATSAKSDHKIHTQAITLLRQAILIKEKFFRCLHLNPTFSSAADCLNVESEHKNKVNGASIDVKTFHLKELDQTVFSLLSSSLDLLACPSFDPRYDPCSIQPKDLEFLLTNLAAKLEQSLLSFTPKRHFPSYQPSSLLGSFEDGQAFVKLLTCDPIELVKWSISFVPHLCRKLKSLSHHLRQLLERHGGVLQMAEMYADPSGLFIRCYELILRILRDIVSWNGRPPISEVGRLKQNALRCLSTNIGQNPLPQHASISEICVSCFAFVEKLAGFVPNFDCALALARFASAIAHHLPGVEPVLSNRLITLVMGFLEREWHGEDGKQEGGPKFDTGIDYLHQFKDFFIEWGRCHSCGGPVGVCDDESDLTGQSVKCTWCYGKIFSYGRQALPDSSLANLLKDVAAAWEKNGVRTLRLIFEQRDTRRGDEAKKEFYHVLQWLYQNHFTTLMNNLHHLASHGHWQDLLALTNLFVTGEVVIITKQDVDYNPRKIGDVDVNAISLDELIRLRADNIIEKILWKRFLHGLPDDSVRKKSIEKFDCLANEFQAQRHREMKAMFNSVSSKISALNEKDPKFGQFYEKIVGLFAQALEEVNSDRVGKWAPCINGPYDISTHLGVSIARSLYGADGTSDAEDSKAFKNYAEKYTTPLRDKISKAKKCKLAKFIDAGAPVEPLEAAPITPFPGYLMLVDFLTYLKDGRSKLPYLTSDVYNLFLLPFEKQRDDRDKMYQHLEVFD